jgi:hypothetical protein
MPVPWPETATTTSPSERHAGMRRPSPGAEYLSAFSNEVLDNARKERGIGGDRGYIVLHVDAYAVRIECVLRKVDDRSSPGCFES